MEAINIKNLSKLYHLRPSQRDWQGLLDATLHDAMTEHLEPAVTELGIAGQEEICVRLVHVPLSFSIGKSQFDTSAHWSKIIAQHIRSELDKGSANVVRYPSRFHALISFAEDISRHTLQRSWAWNQLGLARLQSSSSLTEAREQLTESLLLEPTAIFPAFRRLAQIHRLDLLLTELSREALEQLFDAVLRHAHVDKRWLDTNRFLKATGETEVNSALINATILSKSVILAHLKNSRVNIGFASSPLTLREWVVLILLELEPLLFHRSSTVISDFIAAIEVPFLSTQPAYEWVREDTGTPVDQPRGEQLFGKGDVFQEADAASLAPQSESGHGPSGQPSRGSEEEASAELVLSREQAGFNDALYNQRESTDETLSEDSAAKCLDVQEKTIASEFAGIFFLLPVLGEISPDHEISLINQFAVEPAFNSRSLSWVLYQLSTYWLAIPIGDPGLRVFCGIDIESDWPWPSDDNATEEETLVLEKYAEKIENSTKQKFANSEPSPSSIIPHICRRYARMIIDNGWVELVYGLNDVDTDIRRAGLDLDPGYVPWLGKVVKIRYE